jgi:Mor family transcriptional regulator
MDVEYPEILMDAAAILAKAMERHGMQPDRASDIAFEAVEALRTTWGGQPCYIPKAEYIELGPIHRQVYEHYMAGDDPRQIATDFKYSVQWVRQIIRTARMTRSQKVAAPLLFPDA